MGILPERAIRRMPATSLSDNKSARTRWILFYHARVPHALPNINMAALSGRRKIINWFEEHDPSVPLQKVGVISFPTETQAVIFRIHINRRQS